GVLERASALLFARPMGYDAAGNEELERRLVGVLAEFGLTDTPVVTGLDVGHTSPHVVVPLGCRVRVDPGAMSIESLEAAVS
ncbi:MAG: hypothetical protein WCY60_09625, partial [Trueperaceae bacterium]